MKAARGELKEYLVDLYKKRIGFRWIITLKGEGKPIGTQGYHKWELNRVY